MDISGSVALVTAAHGGIGRAFVADMSQTRCGQDICHRTRHRLARERPTDSTEPARLPQPEDRARRNFRFPSDWPGVTT
jgi:NAD(P)-dependent dehydrogenase (short-subunit alcohol dehydrogenase family)